LTACEQHNPSFLLIDEKELQFHAPVIVKGKTYLTNDHLILQLSATTEASMPCVICNDFFPFPITIDNFTHAEPIEEIEYHIFDFADLLREAILLQIPAFVECHEGSCPERASVACFLKSQRDKSQDQVHYPFTGL
jgi:uncharacterized metal-binding protein YceD (DUF177 family)